MLDFDKEIAPIGGWLTKNEGIFGMFQLIWKRATFLYLLSTEFSGTSQKFYFKNEDGLKLCGILTKPEKETDNCIILCHGITVDKEEDGIFTELAQKLAKVGFAVFRFDFRGHGESEGKSIDMTVTGEERDLEATIRFLQDFGYTNFGVLGASFAGGAVSLFVVRHQNIVKALILWNAIIDYHSLLEPELPWPKKYFGEEQMKKLEKQGFIEIGSSKFKIGKNLFVELRKLRQWKELQKLKVPILFVHGDKDTYVPFEDSVKYSKLLKTAKLETIQGAEHGFHDNKKQEEQADKVTVEFFLKNLAPLGGLQIYRNVIRNQKSVFRKKMSAHKTQQL